MCHGNEIVFDIVVPSLVRNCNQVCACEVRRIKTFLNLCLRTHVKVSVHYRYQICLIN